MRGLDLADLVALAAEASEVEAPKLLELLDTAEVGTLLAEAQPPRPPHETAATLIVGIVDLALLPTGNRRLALLAALQLLAVNGLEADLEPRPTIDLLAAVQAGGHDAASVASWLDAQVTARDPLDGALAAHLSPDAFRAIALAVDRARRHSRLLASPGDLLLGLFRQGTGPAAMALGAEGPTPAGEKALPAGRAFEPATRKAMELALRAATTLGHRQVNGGHLLLGLLDAGHAGVLPGGVDAGDVRRRVVELLGPGASHDEGDLGGRLARLAHHLRAFDPPAAAELDQLTDLLRDGLDRMVEMVLAWRGELFLAALGRDEAVSSVLALGRPQPAPADPADAGLLSRYLADIAQYPPLSRVEETELFTAIRAGAEPDAGLSERRVIQSNLQLVVAVARTHQGTGLPLLDLIQEGNLGLLQAVQRYDPTKGYRFTTFATWWIRNRIQRAAGRPRA